MSESSILTTLPGKTSNSNSKLARLKKYSGAILLLWMPTILAALYYFVIAADIYESEAKFIVHSPKQAQTSMFSNLLQSAGINNPQENLFAVHDYIMSRDAINAISKGIDFNEVYNRDNLDVIANFPSFFNGTTEEDFFDYYQKQVNVKYDATTGITTLTVKSFNPKDSYEIADLLLNESELLVNKLNERSSGNAVRDAESDVERAEERIAKIQAQMLNYRNREEVLDPKTATEAYAESLGRLRVELIMTRARLNELQNSSPSSPIIAGLKTKIRSIERQYNNEKAQLTGSDQSLAPKFGMYEELALRQEFAAKQLASAIISLESARTEARRQQIYLDRVVEPNVPDSARYPQKLRVIFTVFISCFLVFSILKVMSAGIREHTQY